MASNKTIDSAAVNASKATLIAQLRTVLDLTHTEIQVAETRTAQARTEAVQRELTQNAENAKIRAEAIEKAIRELGGFPDIIGPFLGRAAAAVKALTEQAEPFDEALLGDLALEGQLLDRSRYVKALAVSAKEPEIEELATRLITAHSATAGCPAMAASSGICGARLADRRVMSVDSSSDTASSSGPMPQLCAWRAMRSRRGPNRGGRIRDSATPGPAGSAAAKASSAARSALAITTSDVFLAHFRTEPRHPPCPRHGRSAGRPV